MLRFVKFDKILLKFAEVHEIGLIQNLKHVTKLTKPCKNRLGSCQTRAPQRAEHSIFTPGADPSRAVTRSKKPAAGLCPALIFRPIDQDASERAHLQNRGDLSRSSNGEPKNSFCTRDYRNISTELVHTGMNFKNKPSGKEDKTPME